MTNKMITMYTMSLALAVFLTGTAITYASNNTGTLSSTVTKPSEVTGTISSDATSESNSDNNLTGTVISNPENNGNLSGTVSSDTENNGNITGTVVSGSQRSSGSGSRSQASGNDSDSTQPESSGAVLGVAASNTPAPGFPNAGSAPQADLVDQPLWSTIMNFIKSLLSF